MYLKLQASYISLLRKWSEKFGIGVCESSQFCRPIKHLFISFVLASIESNITLSAKLDLASMAYPSNLKALVFGASGITGWPIVKAALEYPTPTTFSQVIGLTYRPLSLQDSHFPPDPRLQLKSGVDLSGTVESIVESLGQIAGIRETTHVYFTGKPRI